MAFTHSLCQYDNTKAGSRYWSEPDVNRFRRITGVPVTQKWSEDRSTEGRLKKLISRLAGSYARTLRGAYRSIADPIAVEGYRAAGGSWQVVRWERLKTLLPGFRTRTDDQLAALDSAGCVDISTQGRPLDTCLCSQCGLPAH